MPQERIQRGHVEFAMASLAALDLDALRGLYARKGLGTAIEFAAGRLALLSPAGETVMRGTAAVIESHLRQALLRAIRSEVLA